MPRFDEGVEAFFLDKATEGQHVGGGGKRRGNGTVGDSVGDG